MPQLQREALINIADIDEIALDFQYFQWLNGFRDVGFQDLKCQSSRDRVGPQTQFCDHLRVAVYGVVIATDSAVADHLGL